MKVNISSMLRQASHQLRRGSEIYRGALEQLADNLEELHDRWEDGENKTVLLEEFFDVYVVTDRNER